MRPPYLNSGTQHLLTKLVLLLVLINTLNAFFQSVVRLGCGNVTGSTYNPKGSSKGIHVFYSVPYGTEKDGRFSQAVPSEEEYDKRINGKESIYCPSYYLLRNVHHRETREAENGPHFEQSSKLLETRVREDCLNLDIYSNLLLSELVPVIVLFSDPLSDYDSLLRGYSETVDHLLTHLDVVVVKVNYRVGPLGFLHFKDNLEEDEFNFGVHDQQIALKWIQKFIGTLRGNRKQVMILAEGVGAAGMGWHLKHSNDLFTHFVLLSATPSNYISNLDQQTMLSLHEKYTNAFPCSKFKSIKYCLEGMPLDQLFLIGDNAPSLPAYYHQLFVPTFDFKQFSRSVGNELQIDKKVIVGYQKWDGLALNKDFFKSSSDFIHFVNLTVGEEHFRRIMSLYQHHDISLTNLTESSSDLNKVLTDFFVSSSVYEFASSAQENGLGAFLFEGDFKLPEEKNTGRTPLLSTVFLKWPTVREKLQQIFSSESDNSAPDVLNADGSAQPQLKPTGPEWNNFNDFGQCLHLILKNVSADKNASLLSYSDTDCQTHSSAFWTKFVFKTLHPDSLQETSTTTTTSTTNTITTEEPTTTSTAVTETDDDEPRSEQNMQEVEEALDDFKIRVLLYQLLLGAVFVMAIVLVTTILCCHFQKKPSSKNRESLVKLPNSAPPPERAIYMPNRVPSSMRTNLMKEAHVEQLHFPHNGVGAFQQVGTPILGVMINKDGNVTASRFNGNNVGSRPTSMIYHPLDSGPAVTHVERQPQCLYFPQSRAESPSNDSSGYGGENRFSEQRFQTIPNYYSPEICSYRHGYNQHGLSSNDLTDALFEGQYNV